MSQKPRWRLTVLLIMLIPLLVSLACATLGGATPAVSTQAPEQSGPVEVNVEFGPGPFDFPDTRAGLEDLSSYKATLTLSFDGTRDGQAQKWSRTYIWLSTKEPAAMQLTIEKAGDLNDLDPVFMVEADGVEYDHRGEDGCHATVAEEGNSLGNRLEPAGFLTFVIGADEAGSETVNGVAVNHYTFDERALAQSGITESTGEMWVASEGGYIVKYMLTINGNADYFGDGIEGTLTLNYELTDVNVPVSIELPADCPAGIVNAPLLPDASDVLNMPGVLSYDTSTSLAEASAFYQEQIPTLGWTLIGEPTITESSAFLDYQQAGQNLTVIITTDAGVTTVNIQLQRLLE